jgi:hypothetical protein
MQTVSAGGQRMKVCPDFDLKFLYEPAPCQDCASFRHCQRTGDACQAFASYYRGDKRTVWQAASRTPCAVIGRRILKPTLRHSDR